MSQEIALQRLLTRREMTTLLEAFQLNAALVRQDSKVFASSGKWDAEAEVEMLSIAEQSLQDNERMIQRGNYRCYPLYTSGYRLGSLVVWSYDGKAPREESLLASLKIILAQALEKREMTNETLDRYREINLLYRLGETIGTTLDVNIIPQKILEESKQVITAKVGMVVLWISPDGTDWDIKASFGEGMERIALLDITDEVLKQVGRTGRPAILTELNSHNRIFEEMPQYHSLLWAPFKSQGVTTGGILLGRGEESEIFTANDEKLLTALTSQAAIAIENARLHATTLEKDRLEREVALARNVQSSLIPRNLPQMPGWEFAAWWQPAREVSGDFYDFIVRKQTRMNAILNTLGSKQDTTYSSIKDQAQISIVIADVSDKGMHAALFMAVTRSILRASALSPRSPADNLTQANRLLCADATGGMFVTVFYAQLDVLKSEMTYVNCGHNPPFHYQATADTFSELGRTGIMVGFDDSWQYEQNVVKISTGDFVAFYTDGVTEAVNTHKQQYSEERLKEVLYRHRQLPANELLEAVQADLNAFMKDAPQYDDITFVLAKKKR